MVNTSRIGFNLFSKDMYIVKLIHSILMFIFSMNYKKVYIKCKDNKKKGYHYIIYIIQLMFYAIGFFFFMYGITINYISNYSETYENCCINHISSSKVHK